MLDRDWRECPNVYRKFSTSLHIPRTSNVVNAFSDSVMMNMKAFEAGSANNISNELTGFADVGPDMTLPNACSAISAVSYSSITYV